MMRPSLPFRICSLLHSPSIRLPSPQLSKYTTTTTKPDLKLLSQLRKQTQVSISKAKSALLATNNSYQDALAWLEQDLITSGASKAATLGSRVTNEGLIGVLNTERNGCLVEMNCETDFVSRNVHFQELVLRIGSSVLLLNEDRVVTKESVEYLPLLPSPLDSGSVSETLSTNPKTVNESVLETISKLGENIQFRRGVFLAVSNGVVGGYVHRNDSKLLYGLGRMGALVALESSEKVDNTNALREFADLLAKHIVGFQPESINVVNSDAISTALLEQEFVFAGTTGLSVKKVLENKALEYGLKELRVKEFVRFELGGDEAVVVSN